jgi:hypothetical protein
VRGRFPKHLEDLQIPFTTKISASPGYRLVGVSTMANSVPCRPNASNVVSKSSQNIMSTFKSFRMSKSPRIEAGAP